MVLVLVHALTPPIAFKVYVPHARVDVPAALLQPNAHLVHLSSYSANNNVLLAAQHRPTLTGFNAKNVKPIVLPARIVLPAHHVLMGSSMDNNASVYAQLATTVMLNLALA